MFEVNNVENWKRIIGLENVSLNPPDLTDDEENTEVNETRAWSQYQTNNRENLFEQSPIKAKKSKEDENSIENILNYIDKHRPHRRKKFHFNLNSFSGTMSDFAEILNETKIFGDFEEYRSIVIYIDAVFRGISQVMFANNPLSGIIILIGLLIGNWQIGLYGLFGTSVSTLTAYLFDVNMNSIRSGLFGYNGCLIGMGISYFSFSNSAQLIVPILFLCAFSTIFSIGIGKILIEKLQIPPFTFSFQVCVWIWLLASLKSRYFFIDGTILSPNLLTTHQIKPSLSNITYQSYTVKEQFQGFFAGVAQVYFIDNPYAGAIILVGVAISSRILSFFALFGSVTGQLTASYFLGVSPESILLGLWGYNSVLTCEALGGMFFVLNGYVMWIIVFYASIMTVIIQTCLSSFLNSCGMPTLTFPFTFMCWIFCLIGQSKYMISIELSRVTLPEDHRKRYKLSNFIKKKLKSLNYIKYLTISSDQHLTWENFVEIQTFFIPILIASYIYENNFKNLKRLYKEHRNYFSFFDENNRSPLHVSVSCGNMKITKWLIEKVHQNPNSIDEFGNTPLFDALLNKHFHLIQLIYKNGGRLPASKSKQLAFILNGFVFEKDYFGINLLISCGLNPNVSDQDGRYSLHIAVINNQFDMVKHLIENYPIWLNMKDFFNQTPIDYAKRFNYSNIYNYLLEQYQQNPIPLRLKYNNFNFLNSFNEKFKEDKEEEIRCEENMEGNFPIYEKYFFPLLFNMILIQKNSDLINEFLNDYPNLNLFDLIDYDYRTIAHYAANHGYLEIFKYLSQNLSYENFLQILSKEDRWNLSSIDQIYLNKHFHIIEFLKQYFLDHHSNQNYFSLLNSNQNQIDSFKKWNQIYLFSYLASTGQSGRIEHLFQRNYIHSNELYHDYHFRTPAHFAASIGHENVIQILMKYNYIGLFGENRWGLTPFHEAKLNHFQNIQNQLTSIKF